MLFKERISKCLEELAKANIDSEASNNLIDKIIVRLWNEIASSNNRNRDPLSFILEYAIVQSEQKVVYALLERIKDYYTFYTPEGSLLLTEIQEKSIGKALKFYNSIPAPTVSDAIMRIPKEEDYLAYTIKAALFATKYGNLTLIKEIEKKEPKFDTRDITYASKLGDPNKRKQSSALVIATEHGHEEIVSYLLHNYLAEPYIAQELNDAFFVAIEKGHFKIAQALLNKGARLDELNANDRNALKVIVKQATSPGVKAIDLEKYKANAKLLLRNSLNPCSQSRSEQETTIKSELGVSELLATTKSAFDQTEKNH
jgi:hypothetical protein